MAPPAIYRQRRPRESALYQCLERYWEEFKQACTLFYEKDYGPLRRVVERTVERFLECGILRPSFAGSRLQYQSETGRIQYRTNKGVPRSRDALDWIALVTSHIPDPHQQMVRYYGRYSNASRGKSGQGGHDVRAGW